LGDEASFQRLKLKERKLAQEPSKLIGKKEYIKLQRKLSTGIQLSAAGRPASREMLESEVHKPN
jgi:hypothetical protein